MTLNTKSLNYEDAIENATVYGVSKITSLDARPSDSISIAIRLKIPILISRKILEEAGVKENYFKEENSKNSKF